MVQIQHKAMQLMRDLHRMETSYEEKFKELGIYSGEETLVSQFDCYLPLPKRIPCRGLDGYDSSHDG